MQPPIRITITDDHPLVITGLCRIFEAASQIEVISTFTSGEALLQGLKKEEPNVLLLDLHMPGLAGTELIDAIKKEHPGVRIIMLTGHGGAIHAQHMINHGCMGFLQKSTTEEAILVDAIKRVHNGIIFLDPAIKDEMLINMLNIQKMAKSTIPLITSREMEVLQLIAQGLKSQEIANKLSLGITTIHSHRKSLLQKLNVTNTAELIRTAMELKLIMNNIN